MAGRNEPDATPAIFRFSKVFVEAILDNIKQVPMRPEMMLSMAGIYMGRALADSDGGDQSEAVRLGIMRTTAEYTRMVIDGTYDDELEPIADLAIEVSDEESMIAVTVLSGQKQK